MALTNFLGENTYLIVDRTYYSRIESRIHFWVCIFTNSSKEKLLACKEFHIQAQLGRRELKAAVEELPTENLSVGDMYLVENNYLEHVPNKWLFATRIAPRNDNSPTDGWSFQIPTTAEVFYMSVDQGYNTFVDTFCRVSDLDTGELVQVDEPTDDPRVWGKWFDKGPVNDNSLLGQCYLYLKHLPEFAVTQDC